jgi:hypothetical protein
MSTEITQGLRSLIPSLSSLDSDFEAKTVLQQQSAKFAHIMANVNNITDSVQFVQAVLNDLETLKDRYRATWSTELDIILLSSQIRVCAFQLQVQSQEQKGSFGTSKKYGPDGSGQSLQHCGFSTAIRLIHVFSKLVDSPRAGPTAPSCLQNGEAQVLQRYLPKYFFRALLFAVSFIFKWMALRASKVPSPDTDLARNYIQLTYRIVSSASVVANDESGRAAKMIEVLSRASDLSRLNMSEPRHDPGSGLHLLEDTIRVAQEIRKSVPQTTESFNNDPAYVGTSLNSVESSGYNASGQSSGLPDAPELSQADAALDMGQDFDWNSLLGFDYSTPLFLDFETDFNISQSNTRE